jgi:hypothetical protein
MTRLSQFFRELRYLAAELIFLLFCLLLVDAKSFLQSADFVDSFPLRRLKFVQLLLHLVDLCLLSRHLLQHIQMASEDLRAYLDLRSTTDAAARSVPIERLSWGGEHQGRRGLARAEKLFRNRQKFAENRLGQLQFLWNEAKRLQQKM